MFAHYFMAPEGRKVGLLKRRVWSHLAVPAMKKCMPLCPKQLWKWTCNKKTPQRTAASSHLWEVDVPKKCTRLWRKARLEEKKWWKWLNHLIVGPCRALLEVQMLKQCTPLWREAHVEAKRVKAPQASGRFWTKRCTRLWREARLEVKRVKTSHCRSAFGS